MADENVNKVSMTEKQKVKEITDRLEQVEVTIPTFCAVSVFDVSQTDGKPIPELETRELLSTVEGYEDFVQALMNVAPVPIGFEDIPGESKGYFHTEEKRIAVQENMSESQTLKTMVHEVAHSMLHDKEINQDIMEPAKDRNTKEVEAESIAYTVCQHFGIDTSEYSFGYIAGWSSNRDMKELKSSLDTIRKTASELITGVEGALQELQLNRALEQEQGKESILLIQNDELTEFSIVNVRGMDTQELVAALSEMSSDDKLSIQAYLESRGAWTTELGNEQTREFEKYHLDVRYNLDTDEIVDVKAKMEDQIDGNLSVMGQEELAESVENKEAQLLYGYTDKYGIYQLKDSPELRDFHFAGTAELLNRNLLSDDFREIQPENYNLVYTGELSELNGQTQGEKLNAIFEKFNIDHPADYRGHSLSVSDIVVLHKDGKNSTHFVDSYGFTQLPEFTRTLEGKKTQEVEKDTSGHDVQKLELEQAEEMLEEGDEIIDLGDEKEQVLADMRKSLEAGEETELAFQIADRYICIQEVTDGYDYSIIGADYKEIDGGIYDNPDVSIREALADIVEDLKSEPDHNGAKGSIQTDDELIPIDYDGLMEKVEDAERIEPKGSVIAAFKAKTNELFHDISELNPAEIEETVKCHVQAKLEEYGIDAEIVDVAVTGSRCRGLEREGSDLDVAVELDTNEREDFLFDTFNENELHIGGVKVDINPITAQRTGSLETYLPQVEDYLKGVREARENEPVSIFNIRMNDEERWFRNTSGLDADGLCKAYAECDKPFVEMEKYGERIEAADHAYIEQGDRLHFSIEFNEETDRITIFDGKNYEQKGLKETLYPEPEVTLTVAECGEFHNLGEFYKNIPSVDEAITIWKQIPPERMNGIPAIGINIHIPGTEAVEDVGIDVLSGKSIDLDILDYIPDIKGNPQAMGVIAELVAKLPDMEIDGNMSEEMEATVWEKRMPDLTPAEQLAVEFDRFTFDYDTALYHDNARNMTENVSDLVESINQGDTSHLTTWLADVIAEGTEPEEIKRATELLEKLAEYKPLAKIEEMEEQNYNMVDNVLNNGAGEKAQKEENKKEQVRPAARTSLKARLAEKKAQVAGSGQDHDAQENAKKNQREV
jgi:predicted nucleotidyltransferase